MPDSLTIINTIIIVLMLIAHGWVEIRDYFAAKVEAKKATAAQEAADAEAAIQARIDAAVAAAKVDSSTTTAV